MKGEKLIRSLPDMTEELLECLPSLYGTIKQLLKGYYVTDSVMDMKAVPTRFVRLQQRFFT